MYIKNQTNKKAKGEVYFFLCAIIALHLSAYWQYERQTALSAGRFHSAPQLGQVVLSSSLQTSSSAPQTWQLVYAGFG
jgi:hypothetical protein